MKYWTPRVTSNHSFRFGDVTVQSIGMIEVCLDVPRSMRDIAVLIDIVPVDIPALDVLDSEQLYACNVINRLVHRRALSQTG